MAQIQNSMTPTDLLRAGAEILNPTLTSAGFTFAEVESAIGSGGAFAVGVFTRADRVLELHVRHALGIVAYRGAGVVITHQDLMRAVALGQAPAYPGFSADSLDGFRHLAADLAAFGGVFLRGSDEEFLAAVTRGEELTAARRGLGAVR